MSTALTRSRFFPAVLGLGTLVITILAILVLLARIGGLIRRRLGSPLVWLVPLLAIATTVPLVGTVRYRVPLDPFLILLASAGLATLVARLRGAPVVRQARSAVPARAAQLVEMVERLA